VWKTLPAERRAAAGAQMVFVSVDPDRDSPDKLKAYATYFNPEFIGVTGKPEQIDRLTGQLGILYGFEDPDENENYAVNHSSQVLLVDPQARLRAVFSPPHEVQRVRSDFLAILDFYGS
ncbi:MAG: SCO family protein, partial [Pseudomonadota bacterium]